MFIANVFFFVLNDLEEGFATKGYGGLDVDTFNIFMLLYADDIVIFSTSAEEFSSRLRCTCIS